MIVFIFYVHVSFATFCDPERVCMGVLASVSLPSSTRVCVCVCVCVCACERVFDQALTLSPWLRGRCTHGRDYPGGEAQRWGVVSEGAWAAAVTSNKSLASPPFP